VTEGLEGAAGVVMSAAADGAGRGVVVVVVENLENRFSRGDCCGGSTQPVRACVPPLGFIGAPGTAASRTSTVMLMTVFGTVLLGSVW